MLCYKRVLYFVVQGIRGPFPFPYRHTCDTSYEVRISIGKKKQKKKKKKQKKKKKSPLASCVKTGNIRHPKQTSQS